MVSNTTTWKKSPPSIELSSNTIEIWRCRLDIPAHQCNQIATCLSQQERQRAKKYRFDDSRQQFVITRARLRQCLALATGTDASEIEIVPDTNGKPFLAGRDSISGIQFNVSHSQSMALIAVTRGQPLGIDVESLEQDVQHAQLAEHFFSAREKRAIGELPNDQLMPAFFACWTRKEALLKAIGTGIAQGLDSFDVPIEPEMVRCQAKMQTGDDRTDKWWIETLSCGEGFAAALAFRTPPNKIRYWIAG